MIIYANEYIILRDTFAIIHIKKTYPANNFRD